MTAQRGARLSRRSFLAVCGAAGVAALAAGCGGGGKRGGGSDGGGRKVGAASLTIRWPDTPPPSRLIPSASAYVVVRATAADGFGKDYGPVMRPEGQGQASELVLDGLPVGAVTLAASAYPQDRDGQRQAALATGATQIEIKNGQTTPFSITLDTAVAGLKVSWDGQEVAPGAAPALRLGRSVTVTASAVDASGALVLVDPANFAWSTQSTAIRVEAAAGGGAAIVTALALTTPGLPGETLTVTDKESGRSTTLVVPVPPGYSVERLPAGDWRAVNAAGVVCGQADLGGGKKAAALWREGQIVDLGYPAGSIAVALSDTGYVAVNLPQKDTNGALRDGDVALWKDGTSTILPRFTKNTVTSVPTGFGFSLRTGNESDGMSAVDVNDKGRVLGTDRVQQHYIGRGLLPGTRLFSSSWTWIDGQFTGLAKTGPEPWQSDPFVPTGINNADRVLGLLDKWESGSGNMSHNVFIDTDGILRYLPPSTPQSQGRVHRVVDLADDGRVIGNQTTAGGEAGEFWAGDYQAGPTPLPGNEAGAAAPARAVAIAGNYVAGELPAPAPAAVLWEGTSPYLRLDELVAPSSGWQLVTAKDVNANGWVLGTGTLNGEEMVPYLARRRY